MSALESSSRHRAGTGSTGPSFGDLLRSSALAFISLRANLIGLGVIVALQIMFASFIANGIVGEISEADLPSFTTSGLHAMTHGALLGHIVAIVLGATFMTGEYASGSIRSTLAAVPRRGRLLAAKAVVLGVSVLGAGIIGVTVAGLVQAPVLAPLGIGFDPSDVDQLLRAVLTPVYLSLVALLSLAVGTILRNANATLTALFTTFAVLPILLVPFQSGPLAVVATLLPSNAGQGMHTTPFSGVLLPAGACAAILVGWVVVAMLTARSLLERRDA